MYMKPILLAFLFIPFFVQGQEMDPPDDYSYQTDRNFFFESELFNYPFYPYKYEEGEEKKNVGIGQIMVVLYKGFLRIDGIEGLNNFNIISTNPKRFGPNYGFQCQLIDSRDPAIEGTLKVITDQYGFVLAIILESKQAGVYIFHLKDKPAFRVETENKYFSRRGKTKARTFEDLHGKQIFPFHWVPNTAESNLLERVSINDSCFIHITEEKVLVGIEGVKTNYEIKGLEYFNAKVALEGQAIQSYWEIKLRSVAGKQKQMLTLYFTANNTLYRYDIGNKIFYLKP